MAKPVATVLLPSALIAGLVWDPSRWTKPEMTVGVGRPNQQHKSSSFQFMSTLNIQFRSLEIILTIWGCMLGFTFDRTLIALHRILNKHLMNFSFPTVG